jgi:hypothetical protein
MFSISFPFTRPINSSVFPGKGFAGCRIILDTILETTRSSVIPVSALAFHVFRVGNTGNQSLQGEVSEI